MPCMRVECGGIGGKTGDHVPEQPWEEQVEGWACDTVGRRGQGPHFVFTYEGVAAAVVAGAEARAGAMHAEPAHERRVALRQVCPREHGFAVDVVHEQLVRLHQQQDAAVRDPPHSEHAVACRRRRWVLGSRGRAEGRGDCGCGMLCVGCGRTIGCTARAAPRCGCCGGA